MTTVTYNYTSSGTIETFTNVTSEPYQAYELDYTTSGTLWGAKYFYIDSASGVAVYEQDFNSAGLLSAEIFRNTSNVTTKEIDYTYSSGGRTVTVTSPGATAPYKTEDDYDASGNLTEHKYFGYDVGPNFSAAYELDFDSSGRLIAQTNYNPDGTIMSYQTTQYVASGSIVTRADYPSHGNLSYSESYYTLTSALWQTKEFYTGITGQPYSAYETDYFPAGYFYADVYYNNDGTSTTKILAGDLGSDTIHSGSVEELLSGGEIYGTVVSAGGLQFVMSGGSAFSPIISSGGYGMVVGGFADSVTIWGGGIEYIEGAAGRTTNNAILGGGAEIVFGGGTASGTRIYGSGIEVISSGGTAAGTIVSSGGYEVLLSGGVASGGVISSGGVDYIENGAHASAGLIATGGVAIILSGGQTSGMSVASNGVEVVSPGGVASNSVLSRGGYEVVFSGGTAASATMSSGGVLILNSGGSGTGVMSFAGVNNEIIVASGGNLSGAALAGFQAGDYIDLKGLGFTSGVTAETYAPNSGNIGGVLTVTSGAQSINLNLLGQYTAANFTLANDGAGGTLIGDAVASSGSIAAQA